MKKIICCTLSIVLICSVIGVQSFCEGQTIQSLFVKYYDDNELKTYSHPFDRYVEDYLPSSADEYSPELAELLMAFAYSAYDNNACYQSYQNFGFDMDSFRFYSHNANTEINQDIIDELIGVGIGRKTIEDGGELIMISVRGSSTGNLWDLWGMTGYTASSEWASDYDFTPDENNWHRGFAKSAWAVYETVKKYVADNNTINRDNIVFVVTGHSRGAAVANLVSVLLSEKLERDMGVSVSRDRIYDYNFACPDVALSDAISSSSSFTNIINFNLASDFVSYVPGVLGDFIGSNVSFARQGYMTITLNIPFINTLGSFSILLPSNWGKYGRSYWYAQDWGNCPIDFGSHAQIHYLENLAYLREQYESNGATQDGFRGWWSSRLPVYSSTFRPVVNAIETFVSDYTATLFNALFGSTVSSGDVMVKRFPLDGDWILTDRNGRQNKVRFKLGQTNMLDIVNGIPGAELALNPIVVRPSASSTFLVDIQGLSGGSGTYIFSAISDNHVEVYDPTEESTEKLYDLTLISSSTGTDKARSLSDERSIVLVLDTSGSMNGKPLKETVKAASRFIGNMSSSDANIGIIDFDSDAVVIGHFGSSVSSMTDAILNVDTDGGTNFGEGLSAAADLLNSTNVKKKILILMSDGEPADGISGEDLFAYADELKESGIIIYTLGFFSEMGDGKAEVQQIMERIASPGYHYEIDDVDNLSFLFEDVSDQLNGQHFIFVRIECPVDVAVSYNGETLSSAATDQNLRTFFGTLSFEESTEEDPVNDGVDRRTKVLRLKEGVNYPIQITGTGQGTMNYSIGLMDRNGEYTDFRRFESIPITNTTVIDTVANTAKSTTLNVDTDSDGQYDKTYFNTPNGKASQFSASTLRLIIIAFLIILLLIEFYAKSDEIVVKKPSMKSRED